MPQQPQEIELKFLCSPDDLGRVLAAAPAGEDDCRELISVYFDTPALDLQKAGASLRVRESRGVRVQTLKRGDGLAREEHEAPILGDAPDPSLGPLPELLPQGARGVLKPAFHVRVTRRQRLLRYDGAEIELALDQGEVRGGRRTSPISEVELELRSGKPAALFGLARQLSQAAPLYLSFATKSQRGQALVADCPLNAHRKARPTTRPDASVAEVFQALARRALAAVAGNAEVLRARPDPAAVHQLRVAVRTLRSGLATFAPALADHETDRVQAELRWLAKALEPARELDVFAEQILAPVSLDARPRGYEALCAAVETARRQAQADVAQAVSSARFRDLLIAVTGWVDTGAWLHGARADDAARPFAARRLRKRRRRLLKDGKRLARASDAQRHAVRLDAKKLRYAAEGFQPVFPGKAARRFIERVKAVQEALGTLNDLTVAETLVGHLHLTPEAAFAAGELVGLQAAGKSARLDEACRAIRKVAKAQPFWDSPAQKVT